MAKDLTAALHQLTMEAAGQTTRRDKTLPAGKGTTSIPARSGAGYEKIPQKATGGGVKSPLVETAYADRTWHADQNVTSTDGLIVLVVKPLKTVNLRDADDNDLVIEYKAPT